MPASSRRLGEVTRSSAFSTKEASRTSVGGRLPRPCCSWQASRGASEEGLEICAGGIWLSKVFRPGTNFRYRRELTYTVNKAIRAGFTTECLRLGTFRVPEAVPDES